MSTNLLSGIPDLRVGADYRGTAIEAAGKMHALVYYGKGDMRVVPDRPIVCTETDVVVKVGLVHRCGTEVKFYSQGRPDQVEESLLEELAELFGVSGAGPDGRVVSGTDYDPHKFLDYVRLVEQGTVTEENEDPLYRRLAEVRRESSDADRADVRAKLLLHWGRITGHETVCTIARVGSRVGELREGIGYCQGETLSDEYLDFQLGERVTVQSRVAYYTPPPPNRPGAKGVQLLGGNILDVAMTLGGEFAQYTRLTAEVVRSGAILRLPGEIDDVQAALLEPAACVLDCFEKTTHELGQDDGGSILKKGVFPGGSCAIIGSGSMAMLCGKLALCQDAVIECGGAGRVLFAVRSEQKADLVRGIMNDPRVSTVVCPDEGDLRDACFSAARRQVPDFRGFDDVIVAAGTRHTLRYAHDLIAPTGSRIMAFAGTRGHERFESGVWHYANAGLLGTSGSNTKMLEVAMGLVQRGSLDLAPLSGKRYTFADLKAEGGVNGFFTDKHLRPTLAPNESVEPDPAIEGDVAGDGIGKWTSI